MSQPGNMGYGQQPPYPAPGPYPPVGGYPQPAGYAQPGPYPPPGGYQQPVGSYPQPQPGQYPPPQQPVAGYMGPAYPPGSIPQGGYGPPSGPQPGQPGAWMPAPHVPNCPPGLEYLTQIDQIIVQQQVEILEGKVVLFHSVSCQNSNPVISRSVSRIHFASCFLSYIGIAYLVLFCVSFGASNMILWTSSVTCRPDISMLKRYSPCMLFFFCFGFSCCDLESPVFQKFKGEPVIPIFVALISIASCFDVISDTVEGLCVFPLLIGVPSLSGVASMYFALVCIEWVFTMAEKTIIFLGAFFIAMVELATSATSFLVFACHGSMPIPQTPEIFGDGESILMDRTLRALVNFIAPSIWVYRQLSKVKTESFVTIIKREINYFLESIPNVEAVQRSNHATIIHIYYLGKMVFYQPMNFNQDKHSPQGLCNTKSSGKYYKKNLHFQSIEVTSPPGTVIGSIHQEWSILAPKFTVRNASDDVILRIEGPFCTYSICGDVEFQVLSPDGSTQVGKISKQWTGLAKEVFTDADNFGITFPIDLDVKMKATLLGAVFLIDFMFFEKKGNKENDSVGML
ncbi:uncharacterized protein LOC125045305 [Penaeus chinensis]|uniref:uncharacterized protein LOC125045305 n=1 Tax=Penaeus chinensis TaxID=139456 RepID=UPI001FB8274C|nr:uncharacterized protein LOC125045305 [Penaeus chinensis]